MGIFKKGIRKRHSGSHSTFPSLSLSTRCLDLVRRLFWHWTPHRYRLTPHECVTWAAHVSEHTVPPASGWQSPFPVGTRAAPETSCCSFYPGLWLLFALFPHWCVPATKRLFANTVHRLQLHSHSQQTSFDAEEFEDWTDVSRLSSSGNIVHRQLARTESAREYHVTKIESREWIETGHEE